MRLVAVIVVGTFQTKGAKTKTMAWPRCMGSLLTVISVGGLF